MDSTKLIQKGNHEPGIAAASSPGPYEGRKGMKTNRSIPKKMSSRPAVALSNLAKGTQMKENQKKTPKTRFWAVFVFDLIQAVSKV